MSSVKKGISVYFSQHDYDRVHETAYKRRVSVAELCRIAILNDLDSSDGGASKHDKILAKIRELELELQKLKAEISQ